MKEFCIKLAIFLIIIFLALKALEIAYTSYIESHRDLCDKPDWILDHSGQDFDFAVIGNSRVENGINIKLMERILGKKGINLGVIGSNYSENFLLLDRFEKAGNKIKNLLIQVDMHSLNSTKELNYPFHDYKFVSMLNDTTVYNVFKDNVKPAKLFLWKHVPFVKYMEFSNRYVLFKMLKGGFECRENLAYDTSAGSVFLSERRFDTVTKHFNYWSLKESDRKYFNRMVTWCKEHKVNVMLYTAPVYSPYLKRQLNFKNIINEVVSQETCRNIHYFDFSSPEFKACGNSCYFTDNIHMNERGVRNFSAAFSDSLKTFLN